MRQSNKHFNLQEILWMQCAQTNFRQQISIFQNRPMTREQQIELDKSYDLTNQHAFFFEVSLDVK